MSMHLVIPILLVFITGIAGAQSNPCGVPPTSPCSINRTNTDADLLNVRYSDTFCRSVMDIWLPTQPSTMPAPVIVHFHGGGLTQGDKTQIRFKDQVLFERANGYAFVSVNYPLVDCISDDIAGGTLEKQSYIRTHCAESIDFLRREAAVLGLDPDRIILAGSSAGTGIAEHLAYRMDLEFSGVLAMQQAEGARTVSPLIEAGDEPLFLYTLDAAGAGTLHDPEFARHIHERCEFVGVPSLLSGTPESGLDPVPGGQHFVPYSLREIERLESEPPAEVRIQEFDGLIDVSRGRSIPYRVFYNSGSSGQTPVIFVSHGGSNQTSGHLGGSHLGRSYAAGGYLAIHVGHLPSLGQTPSEQFDNHSRDRPADVSFLLDRLEAGTLPLPAGFAGTADLDRVGHTGHSWGAYTSHVLAGAEVVVDDQVSVFTDPRIRAICPISPQGEGGLGAFDDGPDDNTWLGVGVPAFTLIGALELDSQGGSFVRDGWRLEPFRRYPIDYNRHYAIVPDADHAAMFDGTTEINDFVAYNTRAFYDTYLDQQSWTPPIVVGDLKPVEGVELGFKGVDIDLNDSIDCTDLALFILLADRSDPAAETTRDNPPSVDFFDVLEFLSAFDAKPERDPCSIP